MMNFNPIKPTTMNKDIKDYLPYYLGCRVFIFPAETLDNGWFKKQKDNNPDFNEWWGTYLLTVENFRKTIKDGHMLALYPLSNIDYDSAETIGKILDPSIKDADDYNGYSYTHQDVGSWFIKHWDDGDSETSWNPYKVGMAINELRKRGYDCDKLIEAGLAIDKNKLQNHE